MDSQTVRTKIRNVQYRCAKPLIHQPSFPAMATVISHPSWRLCLVPTHTSLPRDKLEPAPRSIRDPFIHLNLNCLRACSQFCSSQLDVYHPVDRLMLIVVLQMFYYSIPDHGNYLEPQIMIRNTGSLHLTIATDIPTLSLLPYLWSKSYHILPIDIEHTQPLKAILCQR